VISAVVPPGAYCVAVSATHAVGNWKIEGGSHLGGFLFTVYGAGINGGSKGCEVFAEFFVAV